MDILKSAAFWFLSAMIVLISSLILQEKLNRKLIVKEQELYVAQALITEKCKAVKETVLDEGLLVQAGRVRPGEQLTDRWKALLAGCE